MSLSQRVFSDALCDMQRAMAVFQQPFYFDDGDEVAYLLPASSGSSRSRDLQGARYPPTDMAETAEAYEIHAELPGYDKKDIKVELSEDHRTLVISGSVSKQQEIKSPEEEKDKEPKDQNSEDASESKQDKNSQLAPAKTNSKRKWLVKERMSGSFTRKFSLGSPVDTSGITAAFNNGVLKVVVPKSNKKQTKQINIE